MNLTAPFDKQPKTNSELADLIISRGLAADKTMVEHLLDSVGYYRLTGYFAPFKDNEAENFRPETNLTTIWDIYTFDRHLRLMTHDAQERSEHLRTPFAPLEPAHEGKNLPSTRRVPKPCAIRRVP